MHGCRSRNRTGSMRERDIERKLTHEIEKLGGLSFKWVSPGQTGVPDRIVILPGGRIWFAELKTDTGRTTAVQEYQQKRLRDAGCNVVTIHGEQELNEWIKQF